MLPRCASTLSALLFLAGCGGTSGSSGGGGAGGDGGDGGGGSEPEGCVEHALWYPEPPEGLRVRGPVDLPRHGAGVAQGALHAIWRGYDPDAETAAVVVTSFSAEQRAPSRHRLYDPYPPGQLAGATGIRDAAISDDGAFAVALYYSDDLAPGGVQHAVMLGHLDDDTTFTMWYPPFGDPEAVPMHIGWDGEAFALHALSQSGGGWRLLRIAPDGSDVLPDTPVGEITNHFPEYSDFDTDPATGISRFVSSIFGGVWFNGHERDGTLLSGMEADGGVEVLGGDSPSHHPAVASRGDEAMLAWHDLATSQTWSALTAGSPPFAGTVLLTDPVVPGEGTYNPFDRAITRAEYWWMAAWTGRFGIEGHTLDDDGNVTSTHVLVPNRRCEGGCGPNSPDFTVQNFQALSYDGSPWLAFRDDSDCGDNCPFRLVRVHGDCTYETAYELARQRER